MEEKSQRLSIILKITMDVELFDSSAKQEGLKQHDLAIEIQQKVLGQESIVHTFMYYQTMLFIENVRTNLCDLIIFFIWMYRYYQITSTDRKSGLLSIRRNQINTIQPLLMMLPSYIIVLFAYLVISTVIGIFTNLFIIVVHGMEIVKGRNINPRERILFTLGLFNIAFQCTMAANDTVLFIWSDLYFSDNVYAVFSVLLLFTIFASFWFTFCLCGFYYIMLITSEYTYLRQLKHGISKVVPWMLNFSILISMIISVPVVWNITKDGYPSQLNGNVTYNSSLEHSKPRMSLHYLLVASIIGCSVPLVLVAVTNILIIKSLCVHAKHFGKNTGSTSAQSVQASECAARTVTSLLLLYFSFYTSEILLFTFHRYYFNNAGPFNMNSFWFSVCLVVVYSYSPVQSMILILGSPQLKSTFAWLLHALMGKQKQPQHEQLTATSQIFSLNIDQ